jgi:hypothetical protein
MSKALMLIYFIVVTFIVLLLLVILLLLAFNKLSFESFNHIEEIYAVCAENSKFSVIYWVELDLLVFLRFAWKLHIWFDRKLFILFYIENGYAEIRDAANHQQVAAVSRESHIKHLDSCVSLESRNKFLARVSKDVYLRV